LGEPGGNRRGRARQPERLKRGGKPVKPVGVEGENNGMAKALKLL
jgi:hypothetical protein